MAASGKDHVSRRRTAAGISLVFASISGILSAAASHNPTLDVHDPFEVIAEVRRLESSPLWPGFDPAAIPFGLFDGERTYLVDFPGLPEGFVPVTGRPGILDRKGRHPSILGNTCVQIENVWLASSIPVRRSDFTGKEISLAESAAVIIHEKFHVFQAIRHSDWKPNDGVLLTYPLDTPESLDLRGREIEALRRAVLSFPPGDAAWARTAETLRLRRRAGLDDGLVRYEREVRRLEGLAEYVEYRAAGKSAAGEPFPPGFAPKAVRESAYPAGRWTAVLLDRFVPGWQEDIEAGRARYPEDILNEFLKDRTGEASFTDEESAACSDRARAAMAEKEAERKAVLKSLNEMSGSSIVIDARRLPLRFESFEPFSIDTVAPNILVHKQGFILRNGNGFIHLFGSPALTEMDSRGRVIRVLIPGLARRVRFRPGQRALVYRTEDLHLDLNPVRIRSQGNIRYNLELR
ncbi:MAG: hypothetical protein JW843_10520 [Candidatus Aminicenantes bacterium]|nr:hypothetical protein [Candidatus Aminicenantes bacterium]